MTRHAQLSVRRGVRETDAGLHVRIVTGGALHVTVEQPDRRDGRAGGRRVRTRPDVRRGLGRVETRGIERPGRVVVEVDRVDVGEVEFARYHVGFVRDGRVLVVRPVLAGGRARALAFGVGGFREHRAAVVTAQAERTVVVAIRDRQDIGVEGVRVAVRGAEVLGGLRSADPQGASDAGDGNVRGVAIPAQAGTCAGGMPRRVGDPRTIDHDPGHGAAGIHGEVVVALQHSRTRSLEAARSGCRQGLQLRIHRRGDEQQCDYDEQEMFHFASPLEEVSLPQDLLKPPVQ